MFTGIIQEIGRVQRADRSGKILRYRVQVSEELASAKLGASIAIDGVCQTVTENDQGHLGFEAIDETLAKTTLSALRQGSRVHLEPALRLSDRLDGHLVYGHVDLMGKVEKIRRDPGRWDLSISFPQDLSRYVVKGGSICISGVSLTVFEESPGRLSVSLIPETLDRTLFSDLQPGSQVNLEFDTMAKFAEKMTPNSGANSLENRMTGWGY
jgi:riboflavin synthase